LSEKARKIIGAKHGRDVSWLLAYPNVILVYSIFQEKITKGQPTGKACIKIRVSKKLSLSALKADEVIPTAINDIPTDVEEGLPIIALADESEHRKKIRPLKGGVSIGAAAAYKGATGTACCLVKDKKKPSSKKIMLTNQHVCWIPISCGQSKNQCQPGLADSGGSSVGNKIGVYKRYCEDPLDRPDNWQSDKKYAPKLHHIDAGLIELDDGIVERNEILHRGILVGKQRVKIGEVWFKTGRTTYCTGPFKITDDNAAVRVQYANCMDYIYTKTFEHQIIFENLDAKNLNSGDSGSALHTEIINQTVKIGGLCFAGSSGANGVGVAHHWGDVELYGEVELDITEAPPSECEEGSIEILEMCPDAQTWKRRRVCKNGKWMEETQQCPTPQPTTRMVVTITVNGKAETHEYQGSKIKVTQEIESGQAT